MSEALENAGVKTRQKLLPSILNKAQVLQRPVRLKRQAVWRHTFDVDSVLPDYPPQLQT